MALAVVFGIVHATAKPGSVPGTNTAPDISGTWQGTLHAGRDLRTVIKISKADGGAYKAQFFSIDQPGQPVPVDSVTLDGSTVKMAINLIGGSYEGKLSADGQSISGTWTQGQPFPLVLTRATPETAWTIPPPPPPIPPMADDADPSFEVATIKLSPPDQGGKGYWLQRPRVYNEEYEPQRPARLCVWSPQQTDCERAGLGQLGSLRHHGNT